MYNYLNPDEVQTMVSDRQQQLSIEYQNASLNQADDVKRLTRLWIWLGDRRRRFANCFKPFSSQAAKVVVYG